MMKEAKSALNNQELDFVLFNQTNVSLETLNRQMLKSKFKSKSEFA